jgi:hypothetical protein
MVHVIDGLWFSAVSRKNISGTLAPTVSPTDRPVNGFGQRPRSRASGACSFVVADWREGADPFCGAPTRRHSSYCARHHQLCVLPRDSAEGRSREADPAEEADAAPEPPPELAHLAERIIPESLPDGVGELRALLDHPPPERGAGEPE